MLNPHLAAHLLVSRENGNLFLICSSLSTAQVGFKNHYSCCFCSGGDASRVFLKGAEITGNISETTGVSVTYGRVKRCYHIQIKSCLVHKDSHTMGDFIIPTTSSSLILVPANVLIET